MVMHRYMTESLVGVFMLAGTLAFLFLAFKVSGVKHYSRTQHYQVIATFDNIGGLRVRAPVRVAGVRIGRVGGIMLDKTTYRANVILLLNKATHLPRDTIASIFTEGLLGANYVNLGPGFDKTMLQEGDHLQETHSALVLETLIGHLLFNLSGQSSPSSSKDKSMPSGSEKRSGI